MESLIWIHAALLTWKIIKDLFYYVCHNVWGSGNQQDSVAVVMFNESLGIGFVTDIVVCFAAVWDNFYRTHTKKISPIPLYTYFLKFIKKF